MASLPQSQPTGRDLPDLLPARMLNEFTYCPRLFFYEWVEGIFLESADTVEGAAQHQRVDKPGSRGLPAQSELEPDEVLHTRSLTLSSAEHGVIAKLDLLEATAGAVTPVDYKHGAPIETASGLGAWDPDRIQLAVQALVLRENEYTTSEGVLYYQKAKQRVAVPFVLALALIPVVFSLNRGLWIGLTILAIYAAVNSARSRHYAGLLGLAGAAVLAVIVIVATPLADTIALRVETPHSNDRRATVAETVTSTTWEGSPLLGYGTTRQVQGSFGSITGGATPDCHQCAAPPMGTQGFVWRLVFTTGFVGTILFYLFLAIQMLRHIRRKDGISVVGCMALTVSLVSFMVYDSLESPLFILMLAVGLMNRQRLEAQDHEQLVSRPTPTLPTAGVS